MNPLRTYMVEDSVVVRDCLIEALEEMAPLSVVGTAADEATAVQWLCDPAHSCEMVIIDLFLRGGSGLGVLRSLQRRRPGLHSVVLSNFASDDMRLACLQLGAREVFDKSGEIDALLEHCQALAAS